jgi:hypothetical protein
LRENRKVSQGQSEVKGGKQLGFVDYDQSTAKLAPIRRSS